MLELPSRGWYKLSFDSFVRNNNVDAGFARNNIGALVGYGNFLVVILFLLEIKIRGL